MHAARPAASRFPASILGRSFFRSGTRGRLTGKKFRARPVIDTLSSGIFYENPRFASGTNCPPGKINKFVSRFKGHVVAAALSVCAPLLIGNSGFSIYRTDFQTVDSSVYARHSRLFATGNHPANRTMDSPKSARVFLQSNPITVSRFPFVLFSTGGSKCQESRC